MFKLFRPDLEVICGRASDNKRTPASLGHQGKLCPRFRRNAEFLLSEVTSANQTMQGKHGTPGHKSKDPFDETQSITS